MVGATRHGRLLCVYTSASLHPTKSTFALWAKRHPPNPRSTCPLTLRTAGGESVCGFQLKALRRSPPHLTSNQKNLTKASKQSCNAIPSICSKRELIQRSTMKVQSVTLGADRDVRKQAPGTRTTRDPKRGGGTGNPSASKSQLNIIQVQTENP